MMRIPSSRWLAAWFLLSTAVLVALPQKPGPDAGISGRVTNSSTGAPIVHAHVWTQIRQQTFGAMTGIDGRYSINELPAGQYNLYVDALGFQSPPGYWDVPWNSVPRNQVVLRPGELRGDVNITMAPFGAISGRVMDADGHPLQGISISVLGVEGMMERGLSDPDGRYRIGNLDPGKYRVRATPPSPGNIPPEIRSDGTLEVHYAPTCYPDSLTIESAASLDVSLGSERTGIDISLLRTPIVAVRGTVSGIPAEASFIYIAVRKVEPFTLGGLGSVMSIVQRNVNPDGSFVQWRLAPGSYILNAQSYHDDWVSPPVEIKVADKDIGGIAMRLMHPSDISGRILFDNEEARFPPTPPNASLAQHPQIQIQGQTSNSRYFSVIADDGSFHFKQVRPERYSVFIGYIEDRYVKSLRLGSTNIQGSMLDLRNGFGDSALTVTVSSAAGKISGMVRNALGPVPYARILAVQESEGNLRLAVASDNGRYVTDLMPGKYKLLALDPGAINADAIQYFLDDYSDIIEPIEVRAGDRITRDLRQHQKSR
jgi:hypothetical protein